MTGPSNLNDRASGTGGAGGVGGTGGNPSMRAETALARLNVQCHPLTVARDGGWHRAPGGALLHETRELTAAADPFAVELDDDVTRFEARLCRRALGLDVLDRDPAGGRLAFEVFVGEIANRHANLAASP